MRLRVWFLILVLTILPTAARADGGEVRTLLHQGIERRFVVRVPAGISGPRALLIALHGLTRERWSLFDGVADREGFVVAYPEAIDGRWSYWRGGRVMAPGREQEEIDDAGFIIAVMDRLVADGIADIGRIFLAGTSRGALLAWTLACQHPGRFVAAAPLLSGMTEAQVQACPPARALPIVVVAGTADPVQPYDGALGPSSPRLLSIPETMEFWRRRHGCIGQSIQPLPHRDDSDITSTQVVTWTGCASGGPVLLYRVAGGGHLVPLFIHDTDQQRQVFGSRGRDFDTADELWRVFTSIRR